MNIEEIREFCLGLPYTSEDFPFDAETLVIRVGGKIFTLIPLEKRGTLNLKCDPEYAIELREQYDSIEPGYHMSKKHWNTIRFDGIPDKLMQELIRHAYDLVWKSLTGKVRKALEDSKELN